MALISEIWVHTRCRACSRTDCWNGPGTTTAGSTRGFGARYAPPRATSSRTGNNGIGARHQHYRGCWSEYAAWCKEWCEWRQADLFASSDHKQSSSGESEWEGQPKESWYMNI